MLCTLTHKLIVSAACKPTTWIDLDKNCQVRSEHGHSGTLEQVWARALWHSWAGLSTGIMALMNRSEHGHSGTLEQVWAWAQWHSWAGLSMGTVALLSRSEHGHSGTLEQVWAWAQWHSWAETQTPHPCRVLFLGGSLYELHGRSVNILRRVQGEMYIRPISYQNALSSYIKLNAREKVLVHQGS